MVVNETRTDFFFCFFFLICKGFVLYSSKYKTYGRERNKSPFFQPDRVQSFFSSRKTLSLTRYFTDVIQINFDSIWKYNLTPSYNRNPTLYQHVWWERRSAETNLKDVMTIEDTGASAQSCLTLYCSLISQTRFQKSSEEQSPLESFSMEAQVRYCFTRLKLSLRMVSECHPIIC